MNPSVFWGSLNQTVCALRLFYGVTLGRSDLPKRSRALQQEATCRPGRLMYNITGAIFPYCWQHGEGKQKYSLQITLEDFLNRRRGELA